jgi:stage II sporulation protein D
MSRVLVRCRLCLAVCCMLGLWSGAAQAVGFDPRLMLHKADLLLQEGNVIEAAAVYDQVYSLSDDPDVKALALVRQAHLLALSGADKNRALELYDQAIHEFPDSLNLAGAYFNSGMLMYELGRSAQALARFENFLERFPEADRRDTALFMLELLHSEPLPPAEKVRFEQEPVVRVLLAQSSSVVLDTPQGAHLLLQEGGYESIFATRLEFTVGRGGITWEGRAFGGALTVLPEGGGFQWQGQYYPGEASLVLQRGELLGINRLPMESYLRGVVPAEMPETFPLEALKAQAVAARTYACALLGQSRAKPYDLKASKLSQVYRGVRASNEKIRRAVDETAGEMLVYQDRLIVSYFHAHSGGVVEDDREVWDGDASYYRSFEDPFSLQAKDMSWSLELDGQELAGRLRAYGLDLGQVRDVRIVSRTGSGRVRDLHLATASGGVDVKALLLRKALGYGKMKSTLFDVSKSGRRFVFTGQGFGHGVGMSQWGAQAMARQGHDYRAILEHYYLGVALEKLY